MVLVGAGIGVTPFASLLQALYFRLQEPDKYPNFKTKKVGLCGAARRVFVRAGHSQALCGAACLRA